MKKAIALLISVCMIISVLAGCSGSSSAGSTTAAESKETVTEAEPAQNFEGNTDADFSADEDKGSVEEQLASMTKKAGKGEYFGDLITIGCGYGSNSLTPLSDGGVFGIKVSLFETLLSTDETGKLHFILLKSCEKKDDLTYECELWDFIHDTAGNNVTANDVKFSFDTYKNNGGTRATMLDNIEVTGDYTFIWHSTAPFGLGEQGSNMGSAKIFTQAAWEADNGNNMASAPVGTGPYKLKEFSEGAYVVYEANEDYWFYDIEDEEWLAENDYLWTYQNYKEIRADAIKDSSARAIALENGQVDACAKMDAIDIANYTANPDMGITTINLLQTPPIAFYFNCSDNSICADENLRKAICYGIDNAGVIDGLGVPAFVAYGMQPNCYDSPENWRTGEGRDYYNYDPEKAKEYLAKSGYNGETITIMLMNNQIMINAMIMAQAQLRDIGINLELMSVEQSVSNEKKYDFTAGWDMFMEAFGGGKYLPQTLKTFWSGNSYDYLYGTTVMGVVDEEMDALFETYKEKYDDASLEAWDEMFTQQKCYGYAICGYYQQTACSANVIPATSGEQRELTPGAFLPADMAD